jgi:acyl-CoA reductase-like NAD-dependent aldehyde dehydrogenase
VFTVRLAQLTKGYGAAACLRSSSATAGSGRQALVGHPDVAMVSLTGDVSTGVKVAATAPQGRKRVHLELGGKAPWSSATTSTLDAVVPELVMTGTPVRTAPPPAGSSSPKRCMTVEA